MASSSDVATPPDGGWGWWVVVGAFVINLLTAGSSWAYGVLYVALLDALQATKAETALVGSLIYMVLVFMAPYAAASCRRYGHRRVIMVGGATASIAIIGSSFATSINQLYYTYGLLTGFGYGCCLIPSFLITQAYFKKRMGVAMGIGMAGGGLGMCVMALLTQTLLNQFGWRGTLLLLGAINANICVAGALMRPVSHVNKSRNRAKSLGYIDIRTVKEKDGKSIPVIKRLRRKYSLSVIATYTKPVEDTVSSTNSPDATVSNKKPVFELLEEEEDGDIGSGLYDIKEENEQMDQDESNLQLNHEQTSMMQSSNTTSSKVVSLKTDVEFKSKGQKRCCQYPAMIYNFFDRIYNFALFKDPVYCFFQVAVLVGFMGMAIVTTHVVKRALDIGISTEYAASLVYGMGIGQAIGRTLGGVAVDHMPLNKIVLSSIIMVLCGIATDASIFVTSYIGQQVSITIIGFLFGAIATISFGVLVDTFGAKLLSYTISVCYLVGGIGTIIGPTVAGHLRDKYGMYDYSFHLSAAADVISGLLMFAMIPFLNWHRKINEPVTNEEASVNDSKNKQSIQAAEDV